MTKPCDTCFIFLIGTNIYTGNIVFINKKSIENLTKCRCSMSLCIYHSLTFLEGYL